MHLVRDAAVFLDVVEERGGERVRIKLQFGDAIA